MASRLIVRGGRVVQPHDTKMADLLIEDGRLSAIEPGGAARWAGSGDRVLDAEGADVLPGLVDIHCDTIEKEAEPRPNTIFPLEMAFLQFERKLAGHGITSMFHSLSLGVGLSLRGEQIVADLVETIHACARERAMIRHGVHLRYEVSHLTGFPLAERFIERGMIDYLSLMDHAPGQGQYKRPGAFERYVMKNQGVDAEECARIVEDLQERRKRVDWSKLHALTAAAKRRGIAVASHDDDTPEQVERSRAFGAGVVEFPLNLETAAYATSRGLQVCVGAPNIVRGGSHDKNLTALEAIRAGAADIVCSDYHPASLLHAVYVLARAGIGLADAVRMATLAPAKALGRDGEIGSLEPGKRADVLIVRQVRDCPVVTHTIVNGTVVLETRDYPIGG
ncbi:alpha-D-ribose 1-methylphosphonate 5-triphosphate diphosphatase [Cohnella nanjingensis]|uniref:Alpha-D-ribose 1-methylphosphonate 5-triphosphate diphosphatase n=1 Tax=Cohnella nanjingensis TaxID=1387779 RepID=A0A7X0RUU2_9BACL|nr:alpha-D-ribose 1-methylphosphonate 5-triphosphate diphosphatase [Cohnella nanjingensis]MBB6672499.1 alpha-D-ribose 1-methylphosphonate 5-triphosphate diphosphatase [Cohnella nanjingensis]